MQGQSDKKFTIDVGNGKTIEGVIIFRDCGYQYVGETLLDAFGIKNTSNSDNAYNFNILFSMDKLKDFAVNYTISSSDYNWLEHEIKFGNLDNTDFYNNLGNIDYDWITERAGGGGGSRLFPGGEKAASNYFTVNEETINRAFHWGVGEPSNLVGFNISYYRDDNVQYKIPARSTLDFKLNLLQFTYSE